MLAWQAFLLHCNYEGMVMARDRTAPAASSSDAEPPAYGWVGAGLVLSVFFVPTAFRMLDMAPHIDEVLTYVWFLHWDFLHAVSFYPQPNNHLLNTMAGWMCKALPFDPLINQRLPSLVVSTAAVLVSYRYLVQRFGAEAGYLAACAFASSHVLLYYAWQSRGYVYLVAASVIGCEMLYRLIEGRWRRWEYGMFVFTQALGLAAVPSYLYALSTFAVITLLKGNLRYMFMMASAIGAAGVIASLFYVPVVMTEGLAALTRNPFVMSRPYLWIRWNLGYFYGTVYHHDQLGYLLLGVPLRSAMLLLVLVIAWRSYRDFRDATSSQNRIIALGTVTACLWPYVLVTVQRVLTYERVWVYLIGFLVYGLGYCLMPRTGRCRLPHQRAMVWVLGIVLMLVSHWNFDRRNPGTVDPRSEPASEVAASLAAAPVQTFFFLDRRNTGVQQYFLVYELLARGRSFWLDDEFYPGQVADISLGGRVNDYDPTVPYDIVVIPAGNDEGRQRFQSSHAAVFTNDSVEVFYRKRPRTP